MLGHAADEKICPISEAISNDEDKTCFVYIADKHRKKLIYSTILNMRETRMLSIISTTFRLTILPIKIVKS